jgi:hypothetical protein
VKRALAACAVGLACFGTLGCEPPPRAGPAHGAFGVFFGGQVQERTELEASPLHPPVLGFRLQFAEPLTEPHHIEYEVVRPGPNGKRVTEVRKIEVPLGQPHFDQRLEIGPNVAFGTWNVRVVCDGLVVVDRALLVTRSL